MGLAVGTVCSQYVDHITDISPHRHLNSVDRNSDGDYLVSARYTDTIYKISSRDGKVLWSLGGPESSFKLDGFTFARQHDARFIEENATTTV